MNKHDEDKTNQFVNVYTEFTKHLSENPTIDIESEAVESDSIENINNAVTHVFLKGELSHISQQKPTAIIIASGVVVQLIAFNFLIFFVVLKNIDIEKLKVLIGFMKYYTGAVIVEMLSMCLFIIKGIYSWNTPKMIERILKRKDYE